MPYYPLAALLLMAIDIFSKVYSLKGKQESKTKDNTIYSSNGTFKVIENGPILAIYKIKYIKPDITESIKIGAKIPFIILRKSAEILKVGNTAKIIWNTEFSQYDVEIYNQFISDNLIGIISTDENIINDFKIKAPFYKPFFIIQVSEDGKKQFPSILVAGREYKKNIQDISEESVIDQTKN